MQGDDEHFRAPLLWLLAPYVSGLIAACLGWSGPISVLATGAMLAAIFAFIAARRLSSVVAVRSWGPAISIAAFLGGLLWMQAALAFPPRWRTLPPRQTSIAVELVRIFARTEGIERQSCIGRIVSTPSLIGDLRGQRVFFSSPVPSGMELVKTTHVQLSGILERIDREEASGGGFAAFLVSSGVRFRVARAEIISIKREPWRPAALWHMLGARLEEVLRHGLPDTHPATHAHVAMFLGRKSELSAEQREAFLRSGTMHLFAISGLHIGVIAYCLQTALSLIRLRQLPVFLIGVVLLMAFVEATGGTPSARRALFMIAMIWAGHALRRPANPLSAMCASALVVLVLDPLALLSASFQMSYAVVAAILLYGVPLRNRMVSRWKPYAGLPDDAWHWRHRLISQGGHRILGLIAISVAATSVSLPLAVVMFGVASPGAVLSNVLLLPAAGYAVMAGFASLVCGLCGALPLSLLFNHASALLLWAIGGVADLAARLPGMYFHGCFAEPWIAFGVMLGVLCTCVAGYAVRWRRPRGAIVAPPFLVAGALLLLVTPGPNADENAAMKSAYELAMERLKKSDPDASLKLTDEQKAQLAEVDRVYQGKIAEREIFLNKRLTEAQASGQREEIEQIRKQIASERARLEEDREDAKNRIRRGSAK